MKPFGYLRDRLFWSACALYALNRWWVAPRVHNGFLRFHFNDVLLIPAALPVILYLQRRLGLRRHDAAPDVGEIAFHLVVWSLLFEWAGPFLIPHAVGDLRDVAAYVAGALVAGLWWNRSRLLTAVSSSLRRGRLPAHWRNNSRSESA